jgi:hypothetical protein
LDRDEQRSHRGAGSLTKLNDGQLGGTFWSALSSARLTDSRADILRELFVQQLRRLVAIGFRVERKEYHTTRLNHRSRHTPEIDARGSQFGRQAVHEPRLIPRHDAQTVRILRFDKPGEIGRLRLLGSAQAAKKDGPRARFLGASSSDDKLKIDSRRYQRSDCRSQPPRFVPNLAHPNVDLLHLHGRVLSISAGIKVFVSDRHLIKRDRQIRAESGFFPALEDVPF